MVTHAGDAAERRLLGLFADLLEYPTPGLAPAVRECEALVRPKSEEAAALLGRFRAFVEGTPLARLEEVYTGTFDLDAVCHPYVGYHLFGETYKRSVFLLALKTRFAACGFAGGRELPDHLAVLLRFLAVTDAARARGIIEEALLPALERMTRERDAPAEEAGHQPKPGHYLPVLRALWLVLRTLAAPPAAG